MLPSQTIRLRAATGFMDQREKERERERERERETDRQTDRQTERERETERERQRDCVVTGRRCAGHKLMGTITPVLCLPV